MTDPWAPGGTGASWPPAPTGASAPPAAGGASWPPGLGPPLDPDTLAPEPASRGRGRRAGLTAVAGVLVIGAIGFAATTLTSGDGASSPEAAVESLFDAIDDEDAIGVVESLEPSERQILMNTLEEVQEQAARLGVSDGDVDLHSFPGIDLHVDGLELRTEQLADDVVAVEIVGGTISSRAELDDLPLGPVIDDAMDRAEEDDGQIDLDESDVADLGGGRLVAVKRDGGWHVSLFYSLAEVARLEADEPVPFPSPDQAIAARGAANPEAAVREAIDAGLAADVERLIELTDPEEMRVLHEYGSILVDAAKGEDVEGFEIDDLSLSVSDGPDNSKVVRADTMTMRFGDEDMTSEVSFDGDCTTSTTKYTDAYRQDYIDEWGEDEDLSWLDDQSSTYCAGDALGPESVFGLLSAPAGLEVVVTEHDGEWFLSPTRTLVENTVGLLRDLDDDEISRTVRMWSGEYWLGDPPELWEACGVAQPGLDATRAEGEQAAQECYDNLPDDYDGPWGFSGIFGDFGLSSESDFEDVGDYEPLPEDRCYETAPDEIDDLDNDQNVITCLQGLADQGIVDQDVVDEARCGLASNEFWKAIDEDTMSEEQVDALYDAADEAYETCMAGGGSSTTVPGSSTATTVAPPTTPSITAPPTVTTTVPGTAGGD